MADDVAISTQRLDEHAFQRDIDRLRVELAQYQRGLARRIGAHLQSVERAC
jgi:hypothetical protein